MPNTHSFIPDHSLFTVAQVREMDAYAINTLGVSGLTLMQRAGQAAFDAIQARWPQIRRIAVVCGGGNNGGDGYIVAHLAREAGFSVDVYSLVLLEHLRGDALRAYQLYQYSGGEVETGEQVLATDVELVVDALLGTGLTRPVAGIFAQVIDAINQRSVPVVALDIPSGLQGDTGQALGGVIKAEMTITFVALKSGLFTGNASEYCGDIHFSNLALSDKVIQTQEPVAELFEAEVCLPARSKVAHKGHFGHVLVLGGDCGFTGAALLAAEAAARAGAGLVSIATRSEHAAFLNLARPEIMCHGVDNSEQLKALLQRVSVVVVGPGLGQSEWARELFECVCETNLPIIVDADGLNLLAQSESSIQRPNWVLTPHPGEAARLLHTDVVSVQADRYQSVSAIQKNYGGVSLLKGSGTLVYESRHPVSVNQTGNPGMATGGMGDVLSGVIAALVAQNYSLGDAARLGACVHGAAADRAVSMGGGERGLMAGDLMPYIWEQVNQ